ARYQRQLENYHVHHAKEVADTLARIVRDERIASVIVSGDDVIVPLLKEQFPKDLLDRVIEVLKLDTRAPEHEVLRRTVDALRNKDSETDRERVDELVDTYRANGLATVGAGNVQRALEFGQVDELIIAADARAIAPRGGATSQLREQ